MPLTPETKHLINMQNIEKIKKGAFLINTARGAIVETQAILEGLEKGILGGAGLDVLEEECNIREERELLASKFLESCDLKTQLMDHILLNRDDVIVTPHNAFNSKESMEHILDTTIANIQGFLQGTPQNVVST
jgi:D-lactate dehydrogenase